MVYSKKNHSQKSGFTLLELLVVVAIIGILTTVVIMSVKTSKNKSRDAAIKAQVKQFENLLALEYSETGSYANLQPPDQWFPETSCNGSFTGNHAVKAREICNKIVSIGGSWWGTSGNRFFTGNGLSISQSYSLMVPLNSKNTFFCAGSGGSSDTQIDDGSGILSNIGCYDNP